MPEGNKPLDSDATSHHNWAIFRNEGQYGPFPKVKIEHGYRDDKKDNGQLQHSDHYSIRQLEEDIALRLYILHKMRDHERQLKADAKSTAEPVAAAETVPTNV